MRLPRPIALWHHAEHAPLPAALAGLLGIVVVTLLALPITVTLPEVPAALPARVMLRSIAVPPVGVDPVIQRAPIFSPSRRTGAGTGPGSEGGDVQLLGTASRRGVGVAILSIGGSATTLRVGQSAGGWRLVAVRRDRALVDGSGGRRSLRIGETAAGAASATVPVIELTQED